MKIKNSKVYTISFAFGLILIMALSLWKARYGLGGDDEAFYLSIPLRLCNGEKLFLNEWHGSQLTALVMFPLVKLYMIIFKTTDHIILNFRYIYIAVNIIVTIIAYLRLKKYKLGAVIATLQYMLFVPLNIMALSYNTIGLASMFLSTIFFITAKDYSVTKSMFFSGVFLSVAVLCQPLLAAVFFVSILIPIIYGFISKKTTCVFNYIVPLIVGCIVIAIPVVLYFIFSVGIYNIIISLEGVLSDPEHGHFISIYDIISYYLPQDKMFFLTAKKFLVFFYAMYLLLWCVYSFKKINRYITMSLSLFITVIISIIYFKYITASGINFIIFPWFLHSITMVLISCKKNRVTLISSIIIGVCYAFSFVISNQYGYVFNFALYIPSLIGMMFTVNSTVDMFEQKEIKFLEIGNVFLLVTYTSLILYLRCFGVYWQPSVDQLKVKCEVGPAKGIFLSSEDAEYITNLTNDVKENCGNTNVNTLLLTKRSLAYLCVNKKISQYSVWLSGINEKTVSRLNLYYSMHPENYPELIYITKRGCKLDKIEEWARKNSYNVSENDISWCLIK